ncbi:MAG TPA: hypothetical protein VGW39_09275 [Chthoniobacterales bacterium]|nr:hypothetical protein [Chthoniobacterales bacterium]
MIQTAPEASIFAVAARAPRDHAVVIGASVAGLLAARALADCFERVTVLERETLPTEPEPRKGVPQGHHIHLLLRSGADAIETLFPGFFKELVQRGGVPVDFSTTEGSWFQHGVWKQRPLEPLLVHSQTRPFLEQHLRTRLAAIPNVKIVEQCRTAGLELDARSRVIGVLTKRSGQGMPAEVELIKTDLVVDASGRNSATPKWLESGGFAQPEETSVAVRIGYATRFYEAPLRGWKALAVYPCAPVSTKSGVVFRVEGNRWIVTLMGCMGDYPPIDEGGFLEFARQLDDSAVYDWLQTATPLGPAVPYRYPSYLRRRYERLTRFPEGLLLSGDALCSFNPVYGQGMSVCALEALALRDCLRKETAGGEPLWRAFFKMADRIIEGPWSAATGADFLHPRVEGQRPSCAAFRNWYLHRVLSATGRDPYVSTCFFEVIHLLRKPSALFRPDLLVRVLFAGR